MTSSTEARNELAIGELSAYLTARNAIIAAREGFFDALRAYLRPEQRPDAARLGDRLADSPARVITEDDWVANPVRGYLVVMEDKAAGRPFRLCVLQQGFELRVGMQLHEPRRLADRAEGVLLSLIPGTKPQVKQFQLARADSSGHFAAPMYDWHFDASQLFQSAQAFEDGIYKVSAVFEAALQLFADTGAFSLTND